MELGKWKRRKFTPTWGENDSEPEPAVVVFTPPNVGWMSRWRELALKAPAFDGTDEVNQEFVEGFADWGVEVEEFRAQLLTELILSVENLTMGEKQVSLDDALVFILENEGLRDEVFQAILAQGALNSSEKKA